jgi:TPR repeat protein
MLPRLPLVLGVLGLGAVATTGSWFKREADARTRAEVVAIRTELATMQSEAGPYRQRFENLEWNAAKIRAAADAITQEPNRSWALERARRFADFAAEVKRVSGDATFQDLSAETERMCANGNVAAARENLKSLNPPRFPSASEFSELKTKSYSQPLAQFSRQNPAYYQALHAAEPEVAGDDVTALRKELAAADLTTVTPQALLNYELLSAVVPASDPVLADWAAVISAADFFENPDGPTLQRWREAKQTLRREDWSAAFARMQSITLSTVRTRQPFRAAFGRTILKNRPDAAAEAYPFLVEAAAAGDADARAWVAQEEIARGRPGEAVRWLETSVGEGDAKAVPELLRLYAMDPAQVPRDRLKEAGWLQRITVTPDAPPLASLLLARLYESGGGVPESAPKAFQLYLRAALEKCTPAYAPLARTYLRGAGTTKDLDQARVWATRAFEAGEYGESVPLLLELMQQAPDRTAAAVQELFSREQIAAPAGYEDARSGGPSVRPLQVQLAQYLDRKGAFGAAARLYAQTAQSDPSSAHRHAELTAINPCAACGGVGKVQTTIPCPTCDGKGTVPCNVCDGRGYSLIPGAPPCTTCGGSGALTQEGQRASCSSCSGTGKGPGSVVKQTCAHCAHGRSACRECTGGRLKITKECPTCRGDGSRALADP